MGHFGASSSTESRLKLQYYASYMVGGRPQGPHPAEDRQKKVVIRLDYDPFYSVYE